MALTVTARGGSSSNAASATTITASPGSNYAAGLAVLCISADNSSSGGSTNNISTVTDTLGNVWRHRVSAIFDNGAASAGVQGSHFVTDQSAGLLTTGTTVTITFLDNTTAKSWIFWEITTNTAGAVPVYVTGGSATGQSGSSAPTGTTGTIEVGDAVIGMVAMEAGTTQSYTNDADATNGSWSANQYFEVGSTTTGSAIGSQTKVQTTTASTQTFNPTLGVTCDCQVSWSQFRQVSIRRLALSGVG